MFPDFQFSIDNMDFNENTSAFDKNSTKLITVIARGSDRNFRRVANSGPGSKSNISYENHDIAIAMSPSRADPALPWLGVFKCLIQCYCTGWGYLNIYISITALAGGI